MAYIKVTLEIEVPDSATSQDITEWVDVQYGECNSMKPDNPCKDDYEVIVRRWKREVE